MNTELTVIPVTPGRIWDYRIEMINGVLGSGTVSPETHPVMNSSISDCIASMDIFSDYQNLHTHLLIHEVRGFTVVL